MMRLLKLAATSSLAAMIAVLGADQLKADHDGWWDRQRTVPQSNVRQNWRPAQPTQPPRMRPDSRSDDVFSWFRPQAELPGWQNIEPEAPPAKAPVVYTYRADPVVELGDRELVRPAHRGWGWRSGNQVAGAIFEALKSASSGVRVTEQQRDDIVAFYRERDFAPIWVSPGGDWARAQELGATLAEAAKHALEPEDYVSPELAAFFDNPARASTSREQLARLELALTAAALRYAMHASGGRIVPDRLSAYHDLNPPTVEGREALNRLASGPSPSAYLASLHPDHPAYEALRQALADLRSQSHRDEEPIADGPIVRQGEADGRMPAIRDRLANLGHLAPAVMSEEEALVSRDEVAQAMTIETETPVFGNYETVVIVEAVMPEPRQSESRQSEPRQSEPRQSEPRQVFGKETVEAVRAFQAAAGITVDGIIGPQTIAALNSGTAAERIRRLVYSMERLRWMPRDFGAKHVFANSAAFQTQVIEDGEIVWQSKVIVGKPQYQTVFFSDEMDHVVFNPYWGVPGSIIIRDMLPEVRRDPFWFDREGFEVLDRQGRVIPSSSVDWWNIDTDNLPIGVRQPPGPDNALGEIKFMFPNEHAIYMHDTPSKPLFSRSSRAFSNGCVRVEDPWGFAEIVLGWDRERIESTRATTRNHTVHLDTKVPVHLTYFTAWPDETGKVHYFEDVYGRDELLERAFGKLTLAMR